VRVGGQDGRTLRESRRHADRGRAFKSRTAEEDKQAMIVAGLPVPVAEMNAQAFTLLATGDSEWQTKDVSNLLGVPSRTFEQFVRDHTAAFTADELAGVA
jgi:hypothetical protein